MIELGLIDYKQLAEERQQSSLQDYARSEAASFWAPSSLAGVTVNQETAKSISAYWNGLVVIAGDLGVLDRHLYRKVGDDSRERATNHPTYKLIHDQPNPYTTSHVFWETLTGHALSWGNGYAEIEFDNALRPIGLWNLLPSRMTPYYEVRKDARGRYFSRPYYIYRDDNGNPVRLEYEDVLHVPGLGFDGLKGYSPVQIARQSLGLTIASERFGASFYGNGAHMGVALEIDRGLSEKAQANLKQSFMDRVGGPEKAHTPLILEEGLKVSKPLTIPPDDAQWLEGRQFQIEEIARWLNLPPQKLKHKMGERPGGNFEAGQIEYLTGTLLPWTNRIEQECNRKLISPAQRGTYYVEHLFEKILQADAKTRVEVQSKLFDMHVLDADQIAQQWNLPKPKPVEPPPAPPAPASEPPTPEPAPATDANAARAAVAQRALLLDVARRYAKREAKGAVAAAKRGHTHFRAWADEFYAREVDMLRECIEPAVGFVLALGGSTLDARAVAQGLAEGHAGRSRAELVALPAKDLVAAVQRLAGKWETVRAAELAERIAALGAAEEKPNAP